MRKGSIGVFDSGYGGLTVLRSIVDTLPRYDYLYLGDNARAPYGSRSFDTIYQYTLEAVQWLFKQGCPLVILACNTASAKALRNIQQKDLPRIAPHKKVLGVIRPSTEIIGNLTQTGAVGILGTEGTVNSDSYPIEIKKLFPEVKVYQKACPLWVPFVEAGLQDSPEIRPIIEKDLEALLSQNRQIDTLLMACTHYPLLRHQIQTFLPPEVRLVGQGELVANSLNHYLLRHPEIENKLTKEGQRVFYTSDAASGFEKHAAIFFGETITATSTRLFQ